MQISVVAILVGMVALANCGGEKSVFLTIENYLSSSGADLRANCIKETGVPLDIVEASEKTAKVSEDMRFKCYLKCSFLNSKLMDQSGVVNLDTLKALIGATSGAFMGKVEKECQKPTKPDLCEAAFDACVCILTKAHEEHILE